MKVQRSRFGPWGINHHRRGLNGTKTGFQSKLALLTFTTQSFPLENRSLPCDEEAADVCA